MTFGWHLSCAREARRRSLSGQGSRPAFPGAQAGGRDERLDRSSGSSTFAAHTLTCADQPVLTSEGEKNAFVCKFYTHLQ